MIRIRPLVALSTTVGIALASVAQAENPFWAQFGDKPVEMTQVNGGARQQLTFVDFQNGMLVAELDGGVGEISMPVSDSMAQQLRLQIKGAKRIEQQLRVESYDAALKIMRPAYYPLVKFHQVPEIFTQLHVPIRSLIDTLILAGELDEARDLVSRIELDKVDLKYSKRTIDLMRAFIEVENWEATAELANALPVDGVYAENISPIIAAADELRSVGAFEAVIPLYQAIENTVSGELRINVQMWLAYSLVLADRIDEATPIIDGLEEPSPEVESFSLYKLLQGSREYRKQDYSKALDILTRGFVRTQTSYAWVPEMLYLIGDCYAKADKREAASNVWNEIAVLYPETPWAGKAKESLANLPQVANETVN